MPPGAGRLQAALERIAAEDRGEIEGELSGALAGAEVLVPADPKGEWLVAHQTSAGPALFAFTDLDALEAWAGGLPRFQVRRATELVALALDVGAAALTLDAGSQRGLVLTRDGLLGAADEIVRHGPVVEPPPLPPSRRLLDALRDLAGRHPEVMAAYVYGVPSSGERLARTTVGLEVTEEALAAQDDAATVVAAHVRRGGDVVVLDREAALSVRAVVPPVGAGGPVERAAVAVRTDAGARTALFDALAKATLRLVAAQPAEDEAGWAPQTLRRKGRTYVPVFTSHAAAYRTRPRTQVRTVPGGHLGEVVPAGAWLVLDPGCHHTLELGPDALVRIAARS